MLNYFFAAEFHVQNREADAWIVNVKATNGVKTRLSIRSQDVHGPSARLEISLEERHCSLLERKSDMLHKKYINDTTRLLTFLIFFRETNRSSVVRESGEWKAEPPSMATGAVTRHQGLPGRLIGVDVSGEFPG
jgi:hypothetical protein